MPSPPKLRPAVLRLSAVILLSAVALPVGHATAAEVKVPLADSASYAAVQETLADQRAKADARREFLAKPEMRELRRESRARYRGQSRDEAKALLREVHGNVLGGAEWILSRIRREGSVTEYLSDTVARVTIGSRRQLIDSVVPLRVTDAAGRKRPVDLALETTAGGMSPKSPLVDLDLPAELSEGIAVGSGAGRVRLVPVGAQGAAQAVTVDGQSAMWANAMTDSDVVATAVPAGVETFTTLRSADAPEQLRLAVQADGDVRLNKRADGQIEVRVDDRLAGRVAAPWARDAQGQKVSVQTTIDGTHVVLDVSHRDADVAYPILVDPLYEDWFGGGANAWYHGNRTGLDHWDYVENPSQWYPHGTSCQGGIDCWGSGQGLYMYTYAGAPYSQSAGHYSEWIYSLYNMHDRTTYIPRVELGYQRSKWYGSGANFANVNGIWNPYGGWTGYNAKADNGADGLAGGEYNVIRAGDNVPSPNVGAGKQAVFSTVPMGNSHPYATTAYTGSAVVFLDDPEYPRFKSYTHSNKPPEDRWVKDFTDRITITARDSPLPPDGQPETQPGTGISAFNFYTGSKVTTSYQPNVDNANDRCYGTKRSPCWPERTAWHDYSAASLGDGEHKIYGCAYDALGRPVCAPPFTVKVDRTEPALSISGLSEGQYLSSREIHPFSVSASDTRAGLESIESYVDGELVDRQDCSAGCSGSMPSYLDPEGLGLNGLTEVLVRATDRAGNTATKVLKVDIEDHVGDGDENRPQLSPGYLLGSEAEFADGQVRAQASGALEKPNCGVHIWTADAWAIYTIDYLGLVHDKLGRPQMRYHIHWRLRKQFWADAGRTWLSVYGTKSDGSYGPHWWNDSNDRRPRAVWKRYYAHTTVRVKPGTEITNFGRSEFEPPIPVPGGQLRAVRLKFPGCWARTTATPRSDGSGQALPEAPKLAQAPAEVTSERTARFTIEDAVERPLECQLDDGAWGSCAASAEYRDLTTGRHTFLVKAPVSDGSYQYAIWVWDVV